MNNIIVVSIVFFLFSMVVGCDNNGAANKPKEKPKPSVAEIHSGIERTCRLVAYQDSKADMAIHIERFSKDYSIPLSADRIAGAVYASKLAGDLNKTFSGNRGAKPLDILCIEEISASVR